MEGRVTVCLGVSPLPPSLFHVPFSFVDFRVLSERLKCKSVLIASVLPSVLYSEHSAGHKDTL